MYRSGVGALWRGGRRLAVRRLLVRPFAVALLPEAADFFFATVVDFFWVARRVAELAGTAEKTKIRRNAKKKCLFAKPLF
jgi:hypothetical protein